MARKKVNLVWNVLLRNSNGKGIRNYNVLYGYNEDFYKDFKKGRFKNLEEFKEYLRITMRCRYWCRTEYEILVGGKFDDLKDFEKIDAFRQIEMNLDRMVEYINKEMRFELV